MESPRRHEQPAKPGAEGRKLPAYLRVTQAETWVAPGIVIVVAVGIQIALPTVFPYQRWVLPGLAGVLMVGLVKANPKTCLRRLGARGAHGFRTADRSGHRGECAVGEPPPG